MGRETGGGGVVRVGGHLDVAEDFDVSSSLSPSQSRLQTEVNPGTKLQTETSFQLKGNRTIVEGFLQRLYTSISKHTKISLKYNRSDC